MDRMEFSLDEVEKMTYNELLGKFGLTDDQAFDSAIGWFKTLKEEIDMACRTAEEFTKHFYECLDKKRHLLERFFVDLSILVWNGNGTNGKDRIADFLIKLPPSEHKLCSLDSQRILDAAIGSNLAYLIMVGGTVRYNQAPPTKFTESFLITNVEDKWKVISDRFRTLDPT